ncbi:MAG: asparagine synthase-related protein [Aigarchaeota archaeon]|nr:asparagine synthase-related protein [Aigarchaeota archaeon]MCX8193163.1 asparagine synthase-related protein [Nitrososphaeria archaeon]MDW7986304.1 asparagine synthase-related protein [Nitrososphaerota archaeon]
MSLEPSIYYLSIGREIKIEKERDQVYQKLRFLGLKDYREIEVEYQNGRKVYLALSPNSFIELDNKRILYLDCYPTRLLEYFHKTLSLISIEAFLKTLNDLGGFFSGFIVDEERVLFFRDHVGSIPIVFKIEDGSIASAPFSRILEGGEHIPPGRIVEWKNSSLKIYKWYSRKRSSGDYIGELSDRLHQSVSNNILEDSTIAFSGGLDSLLLTYIALKIEKKFTCITVGTSDAVDLEWAEEAASTLGLDLRKIILSNDLVKEVVGFLSPRLPRKTIMDLSLASIFYIVASNSVREVVISGQGADELFGGYYKYFEMAYQKGLKYVEGRMLRDLLMLHKTNIERDYSACSLVGKRFVMPYLDRSVYDLAISIPVEVKLVGEDRVIRKLILKKVAKLLGIPEKLVERPKKAAQYSSNIQKSIKKVVGV